MNKYLPILILFFSFLFSDLIAQKDGCVKFESYNNYVGIYKQDFGLIETSFIFKNECELTLHFENIRTSSGSKIINYPKGPILPGNNGIITAAYNSSNRIGKFIETIWLKTNIPDDNEIVLSFSGEITPKDKTTIDYYPHNSGNLNFQSRILFFDKILNSETRSFRMPVYNTWDKSMTFSFIDTLSFISCRVQPEILEPGEEGIIVVTYNASKRKDYGIVIDTILISTNDEINPIKKLLVKADIFEDFSKLRESKRKIAPKISFINTSWDFGLVKQGDVIIQEFEIKNKGIRELNIRKMDPSCSCISVKPLKLNIRQQKTSIITVTISTKGFAGKHDDYITVISNDPENPRMRLYITGEIR